MPNGPWLWLAAAALVLLTALSGTTQAQFPPRRPRYPSQERLPNIRGLQRMTPFVYVSARPTRRAQLEALRDLGFQGLVNMGRVHQLLDGTDLPIAAAQLGLEYVAAEADSEVDWLPARIRELGPVFRPLMHKKVLVFGRRRSDFGALIAVAAHTLEDLHLEEAILLGRVVGLDDRGARRVRRFLSRRDPNGAGTEVGDPVGEEYGEVEEEAHEGKPRSLSGHMQRVAGTDVVRLGRNHGSD